MIELLVWFFAGMLVGLALGWFLGRYKWIEIRKTEWEDEDETELDAMQKKNREFLRERGFELKRKRMD